MAYCHTYFAVQTFLADKNSLDLAPYDLWLFLNLKLGHKDEHYESIEDIKVNTTTLRVIQIEGYQRCFQQLQSLE